MLTEQDFQEKVEIGLKIKEKFFCELKLAEKNCKCGTCKFRIEIICLLALSKLIKNLSSEDISIIHSRIEIESLIKETQKDMN